MSENSPLGKIAFWLVAILAVIWAAATGMSIIFGVFTIPFAAGATGLTGLLAGTALVTIIFGPILIVVGALILDRMSNTEDEYYSKNIHD